MIISLLIRIIDNEFSKYCQTILIDPFTLLELERLIQCFGDVISNINIVSTHNITTILASLLNYVYRLLFVKTKLIATLINTLTILTVERNIIHIQF